MEFLLLVQLAFIAIAGRAALTTESTTSKPCAPGTRECTSIAATTIAVPITEKLGAACEIGLAQCPELEQCVPLKNNRSRTGACQCIDGFVRNRDTGICQRNGKATGALKNAQTWNFSVRIFGPEIVQLPIENVNLTAIVEWNGTKSGSDDIRYSWTMKSSPLQRDQKKPPAVLGGRENETLHLHELHVGPYVFGVRVTIANKSVDAEWKLNVSEEKKANKPPVAVVQPPMEEVKENTQIILDGSSSKDGDGKIIEYVWTQIDGPEIPGRVIPGASEGVLARAPTLTLSSLHPGNYSFKLTVKDNDGAQSSALSRVFVTAEVDYPPKAVAGSCDGTLGDVAIRLPIEALYLCGNKSTDDKGIVKWKWTLKDTTKNTADMEGTGRAVLKVWNLHTGDYTFHLVVEDAKGQTSSADVHVVVLPALNKPPVAKAGQNQTVRYPESSVILDGSLSSDDKKIASYLWYQVEGPATAVLTNFDKVRMTATGLEPGVYIFGLNVTDEEGLSDVDHVFVTVDASNNRPPTAVASDLTISLPCNVAVLNASASTDDAGVVRWLWFEHDNSPAGLELLGNTWQQPLLRVSNLRRGIYTFNLTVFDKQGAAGTKLVKLSVVQGEKENETVEIYLKAKLVDFTVRHQRKLTQQLKALLETNPKWDRVDVNITKVTEDPNDGSVRILFYATASSYASDGTQSLLSASVVADYLESHSSHSEFMADFAIRRIDSLYCHNNCSGRGRCDEFTKRCICDRYWMPNLFAFYSRGAAKDCDWSVLYFVLVLLLILLAFIAAAWFILRGSGRCRSSPCSARTRAVARRVRRYRMLKNDESPKGRAFNLKALKGRNGHTPIVSDSDLSSEEETVYDRSSLLKKHQRQEETGICNGVTA